MTKLIKILFIAILFTGLGYAWCLYHCHPVIKEQKQAIKMLNKGYTKEISKDFLEIK